MPFCAAGNDRFPLMPAPRTFPPSLFPTSREQFAWLQVCIFLIIPFLQQFRVQGRQVVYTAFGNAPATAWTANPFLAVVGAGLPLVPTSGA